MSWYLSYVGKPKAVLAKLAADQEKSSPMAEPEQGIKNKVVDVINTLVGSLSESTPVKVEANGSQSGQYNPETGAYDLNVINNVRLEIVPFGVFIE